MFFSSYVLIFLIVIVIAAVLLLRNINKKMYTPTQGEKIKKYEKPCKALLVVDVQEDLTGPGAVKPYKDTEEKIVMINKIIQYASDSGMEVAYIRHGFKDNFINRTLTRSRLINGQPGIEVDSRINVINKNDFTKKISDAFSNIDLNKFLIDKQVDEVYITGLDAVYCVYYTSIGALNRGYKVTVIEDAIMTHKNMSDVVRLYEKSGITLSSGKNVIEAQQVYLA
ncbi:cysteine hydrolase family protein [Geosporobacter ferrireducens]|uniref:Isochorismatase-like domain-containing protein n=1 Tax=Geosporobacter ferrireducens TaxID=1424294 RepID=A0A1D8GPA6_9FIRM|nr:isochorismatase family cysteine hydrolase [Geosporobacter ferrireducens]AOT72732.1 hypothetical protein Gferi_26155 [Geosporobacter ferrireducens]MTI55144.1 cysteine hydrolase [Geosporobacter ferrireducens]